MDEPPVDKPRSRMSAAEIDTVLAALRDPAHPDRDQGIELLYRNYLPVLLRLAHKTLGNEEDAEDAVMEALIRLCRASARLRDADHLQAWLYRALKHACLDQMRKRKPTVSLDDPDLPWDELLAGDELDPAAALQNMAWREAFGRSLRSLKPVERDALTLIYLQSLSYEEAATHLDLTINTVRSHVHRAKKRLQQGAASADLAQEGWLS